MYVKKVKVQIHQEIAPGMEMRIFDYTGKPILKKSIKSNDQQLDVSGLSKGVYFIHFLNENTTIASTRFIVS